MAHKTYRQHVRRDHLDEVWPPIRHIADAQLNIDKQIAIIDGFDWHGHVLFRSDEVP